MKKKLISTSFKNLSSSANINKSTKASADQSIASKKPTPNISKKEYKKVLGFAKRIHRQGQLNLGAILFSLFNKARGVQSNETMGTKWLMGITKAQIKNPELISLLEEEIQSGGMQQVITTLESRIRDF